jgi:hypothetical protein
MRLSGPYGTQLFGPEYLLRTNAPTPFLQKQQWQKRSLWLTVGLPPASHRVEERQLLPQQEDGAKVK